ncbi:MAG: hypothetical protein ACE5R6_12725 [Candidatus Heimdallarchaeota archaeon]
MRAKTLGVSIFVLGKKEKTAISDTGKKPEHLSFGAWGNEHTLQLI